jgi:hypothetical protein
LMRFIIFFRICFKVDENGSPRVSFRGGGHVGQEEEAHGLDVQQSGEDQGFALPVLLQCFVGWKG